MEIPERLRRELAARGLCWPAAIEHFESIGSTSDRLKEEARTGAREWSVVLADQQTAGRGRQGRVWQSPLGNLHLSVLVRPTFSPQILGVLPLAGGLAVAEGIDAFGIKALLKWPNDVVIGERKLAGILAEGLSGGGGVDAVVLGIGVNVTAESAALAPDVRARATSIAAETRRSVDTIAVAAAVLARLTLWYDALGRDGAAPIVAAWRARAVPWWGRTVEIRSGTDVLRGVARDVDEQGALLLDLGEGRVTRVLSGEVRELRLP